MLSDERPPGGKPSSTRTGVAIVSGFALLATLGVGVVFLVERASLSSWARRNERFVPTGHHRFEFYSAGLKTPPTRPADQSALKDKEQVIGIEAGGKARAYPLRRMNGTTRHIINDVVGGVAVTVTYCDITGCARAFNGGVRLSPLDVSQAGLLDGRMVVKVGGVSYLQETGEVVAPDRGRDPVPFPYPTFPLVLTTWGEWKARHADTDVSEGHDPVEPARPHVSGR